MELIWIALAGVIGAVLYKYFTGHGGIKISRAALAGLPAEGSLAVGGSEVRWTAAADDAFVAGWPLPSGHWVVIRVSFEAEDEVEPDADTDQGRLELAVGDRQIVGDVTWTDQITDRDLRSDVENVLKALASAAKRARSDSSRAALAKPVGSRKELE